MSKTKSKKKFKTARAESDDRDVATVPTMTKSPASRSGKRAQSGFTISTIRVGAIMAALGLFVFLGDLASPFMGDDTNQIVNSVPVHSIGNILLFFQGSTFYNGGGLAKLTGNYFRPLMLAAYSLVYSLFGSSSVAFHLFQMLIFIASAFLLFLVFKYFFRPAVAFLLALVFLVHPLNSQVVFAIPSLQDALCFFFGILGFWLLLKYKTTKQMLLVAACLFLSMLSKETGLVFTVTALVYLALFDKQRLKYFVSAIIAPVAIYLALRIHAVGITSNPLNAPIDSASLVARLLTAPSIMLFYVGKFLFPLQLSSGYYWVFRSFSVTRVALPLLADIAIITGIALIGRIVKAKSTSAMFNAYIFFAAWAAVGLLPYLQIVPLDFTACETWFCISMAGILGMIGIILDTYNVGQKQLLIGGIIIISALGLRTSARGFDWDTPYTLAAADVTASPEDYNGFNTLAGQLITQGNYAQAESYAKRSVAIFPTYTNYCNLGISLADEGHYAQATTALSAGLKYGDYEPIYENLATLTLVSGTPEVSREFFHTALTKYPKDSKLWLYLSLYYAEHDENTEAKQALTMTAHFGPVPPALQQAITNDQVFTLKIAQMPATETFK